MDERDVLLYYLNGMRNAVIRKTEGLTDQQLRTPGVPSGTNLLGLIQHLTGVERHWFQRVFLGEESTLSAIANPGEDQQDPLRVILVHLIRETARHAGHADILREQLDGATGQ